MKKIVGRILEDIKKIKLPLIVLILYGAATQIIFHTVCPWAILTHYPCPACGLTRAGLCVIGLRFAEAARMNGAIFLWVPYIAGVIVVRYVLGKWTQKAAKVAFSLLTGIILITCVYFVLRLTAGMLPQNILPEHLYRFPAIW